MTDQPTVSPTLTIDQALDLERRCNTEVARLARKRKPTTADVQAGQAWHDLASAITDALEQLAAANPTPTLIADYRHLHCAKAAIRAYRVADLRQRAS